MSEPRKASLLVVFLTVFIDLLGFGMVLPLLPIYAEDFAVQFDWHDGDWRLGLLIGLLMSSFSLMQFLFAPLWGRLSDRIGRRPVLMVGLAGSVAFYALFGLATVLRSIPLLFVARIGAGISGATIATAQAYIADATSLQNRAKGMALIGAAFGLGFTFGPLFGALAVLRESGTPSPWPGYAAAILSAGALLLAAFKLPESLQPGSQSAKRKWFDLAALRDALTAPSIGLLLLTSFICVFSFANFETTLSLTLKDEVGGYNFSLKEVSLTFAYIGFILTIAQGGLVRRLSGKVSESVMAGSGAVVEIVGFLLMAQTGGSGSVPMLLVALAIVVTGFAMITPSLNSLLSRRSDPAKQGGILGIGQSISALARILAPMVGVPLLTNQPLADRLGLRSSALPPLLAMTLMAVGLLMIIGIARAGKDYAPADKSA